MTKIQKGSIRERVARFLTKYRTTPHTTTGLSPAELLSGRQLRTHLDLLHPNLVDKVMGQREAQKEFHDRSSKERHLMVGEQVLAQNFSGRGDKWIPGLIIEQSGHYFLKFQPTWVYGAAILIN